MRQELAKTPAPAPISDAVLEQRTIAALRERPQKLAELTRLIDIPAHQEYRVQALLGRLRRERRAEFRAGPNLWAYVGEPDAAEEKPETRVLDISLDPRTGDQVTDQVLRQLDDAIGRGAGDQVRGTPGYGRIELEVSASCDLRAELVALARDLRTGQIDCDKYDRCYQALNAACAIDQVISEAITPV